LRSERIIAGEVKDSNRKGRKGVATVAKGSVATFFANFASSLRSLRLKAFEGELALSAF